LAYLASRNVAAARALRQRVLTMIEDLAERAFDGTRIPVDGRNGSELADFAVAHLLPA
jgi:hypothetical protein